MPRCATQVAREQVRADRQRRVGDSRASAARRQAHPLRQWRLGHRRQRLGHRLRASAAGYRPVPAVSLSLEPANITAVANDVGTEAIFLRQLIAQARPEDVAVGNLDQRRLAQHHHGARRGAQAQDADRRAAGLRRRRNHAPRPGRFSAWWCSATTSRAFRKCRPRSITSFANRWRCLSRGQA